ncbi:ATP-binding cassette domain-containing protein [Kitasatospora sp. NA04385]|uniref:ATP-binding cassette domain-containing protein n=1 Tax=Kitasatospora sp. NA04385 TaxID=2742135 RepID=UPI00116280DD|nr:ATP-binding cassette domain-containing protein [Kitasatospora sp. NA04385]QDJ74277.1 ATP-binding protein [Kitasatospora sp.]
MDVAIEVAGLRKRYRETEALRGVDLSVPAGTVLGLLGPNGAGKTTTIRILTTLLEPDEGTVRVAGFDVVREPVEVRRRIGLTGQYAAVDELLTGRENLTLIGRLYGLGRKRARARADELLEVFDLTGAADRTSTTYSGGMRRRLDLAASLLVSPEVIFLDEPTTGLDPTSRMALWQMVREQVAAGVTVLLTTQYLEEADHLADRIAVIDTGRVIAEGTANELKRRVGGERVEVVLAGAEATARAAEVLSAATGGPAVVEPGGCRVSAAISGGIGAVAAVAAAFQAAGLEVDDFALRKPSLDEVFMSITGQAAQQPPETAAGAGEADSGTDGSNGRRTKVAV